MADEIVKEVIDMANRQYEMARDIEAVEATLEDMRKRYNRIKTDLLPDLMRTHGIEELKLADGSTIKLELGVSITVKDQQKFYSWLDKNKLGGIIKQVVTLSFDRGQEELDKAKKTISWAEKKGITAEYKQSIHGNTLKAFAKNRLQEGKSFPRCVDAHDYTYADIKLTKKES